MKRLALIFALVVSTTTATATELADIPIEKKSQIFLNMATDIATCSAFYQYVSQCMNNTEPDSGSGYEMQSIDALQSAAIMLMLSNTITLNANGEEYDQEKMQETSARTVHNWFKRDHESMIEETMTCSNISILTNKHLLPCNEWVKNPDALFQKWSDEIIKRD
jgi:hypothetical protein